MAKFDKIAVLKKIGETGMVPVFYHKDLEICKNVVKACYEGGVLAFEFTNRGDFALLSTLLQHLSTSSWALVSWSVPYLILISLPFATVVSFLIAQAA